MTKKVVYNTCYGGFSLSYEAVMLYAKLSNINLYALYQNPKTRKFYSIYDDNNAKKLESFIH